MVLLLVAAVLWGAWTAISVWLSFRSIDRLSLDLDEAREAIADLPIEERPPPPPLDVEPEPQDPGNTTGEVQSADAGSESSTPPGAAVDEVPLDPDVSRSPRVPDDAFDAFLIIGSDARPGLGGSRADVIILALLPADGSPPMLVSLPRDLWLPNACSERPRRINAALNGCGEAATGPELLALTVADFTGIVPDHFALFNFDNFTRVIDAFGGIDICVRFPVRDENFELPAGCTDADGETALGWVRSRHTEEFTDGEWRAMRGVNDLTRNERQRDLLLQLLGKVRSFNTVASLVKIVDSIADAVTLDDELNVSETIALAWNLRDVSPVEIKQITIPVTNYRTDGGAQVLLPEVPFAEVLAQVWPAGDD